jgi:hypothetical protein
VCVCVACTRVRAYVHTYDVAKISFPGSFLVSLREIFFFNIHTREYFSNIFYYNLLAIIYENRNLKHTSREISLDYNPQISTAVRENCVIILHNLF